jgi:hypothetical protein
MQPLNIEYWKPNKATYNKIQQLKAYVNFIAQLKYCTEKDKKNAEEINYLIENINHSTSYKNWMVCLDIYDRDVQYGTNKNGGFYWRKWSVYFENGLLEITAESKHTSENLGHFGDDFYYYGGVYFYKNIKGKHIYLDTPITEFIDDAKQYKKYITETLNDIEIEIDVW